MIKANKKDLGAGFYTDNSPDIEFLMSSKKGLFLFSNGQFECIIKSKTFGITKYKDEWWVVVHTESDGRKYCNIVSFKLDKRQKVKNRIVRLSREIHQIDFIGDDLVVTDTINNRLLIYEMGCQKNAKLYILGSQSGILIILILFMVLKIKYILWHITKPQEPKNLVQYMYWIPIIILLRLYKQPLVMHIITTQMASKR